MAERKYDKTGRLLFTEEMKKEYTILYPTMLTVHWATHPGTWRDVQTLMLPLESWVSYCQEVLPGNCASFDQSQKLKFFL